MRVLPLGEVARVVSGGTPKTSVAEYWDGDIPWATPTDLSRLNGPQIADTARTITAAGLAGSGATVLPVGSVLLSSRAPIGYVAMNAIPMATNQGFKSLVPGPELDAGYLYHWLRWKTNDLKALGNGATFAEISKRTVERILVPLPPMREQRRIAAILHAAEAIRSKRKATVAHLDTLVQAHFAATFGPPPAWSGRWPMGTIGDRALSADYGTSTKAGAVGDWPVLRMGNITDDGRLDLTDLKYLDLSDREEAKYSVRRGDLLFNRTNSVEKVGKSAVVKTDERLAYAGYLVRVRFDNAGFADFVSAYLNGTFGRAVRRSLAKAAVNQANINAKELRGIRIALPDGAALERFSRGLDAIDAQRTAVQRALAADEQLSASLQSRAFSGKL
ncbi:restriction endonuclease subunit S [Leifsonia sp. 2MCAF36]|uniref:restriction endonuclease subunit S n=1 Tax=Leifsonia sp. 2MCAF36 TaxID=3232988 RepID=UPI003F9B4DBF